MRAEARGRQPDRPHERSGPELTLEATKDPCVSDFLELAESARERELEQALIDDIERFLLELGSGFAFYGRQAPLVVGDQEFFLDLLFYHHTLRRFAIVELKLGAFEPGDVSKMNFFLNAVDEQLRVGDDRESVGIILCAGRNESVTRMALQRVYSPIDIATWQAGTRPEPLPAPERELAELDAGRDRLVEHVAKRAAEIEGEQA